MITRIPEELTAFINKYSVFYILGHAEPDGDCLGSQQALASALSRLGKITILCSPGPFFRDEVKELEEKFSTNFENASIKAGIDKNRELAGGRAAVIITDCSTPDRIGSVLAADIKPYPTAVIDHHATGVPFGDVSCVDGTAPSTTVLIYMLIKELGLEPTVFEAEELLFGFLTDTGYFRHLDNSTADSIRIAAELVAYGASPNKLYYRMYGGRKLESRLLLGRLLSRAESFHGGNLICIYETLEDKTEFGSENRDSDALYSQLFGIKGCRAVSFVREEEPGICSVSLRSIDDTDVGKVAGMFGGGGHKRAAGFEWKGDRKGIEEKLVSVFHSILSEQ